MTSRVWFITGTDTGVGKTVLACLLARHLHTRGRAVAAVKPICSGGRGDARALGVASGGWLTLDEINPWHFRAPLAPVLAARREKMSVRLADVLAHVRAVRRRFDCVLVEGAGGVLSPLGEGFSARELIVGLRAVPAIACPNRLGAVNQALLAWAALPRGAAARSRVVLMTPRRPDTASASNAELLREHLSRGRVHVLPWLDAATRRGLSPLPRPISEVLDRLLAE